ncbi:MAG: DUF5915 domain-containing protein, partial [Candidatus Lokiarchaeota archaeon]|nr:DUF5915 domain-containing protein [Candidatus Lokiarchaeota archaeon]
PHSESIHLQDYPTANEKLIDIALEAQMDFVQDLIENVRAIKDQNKIKLKWPNRRLIIEPKEGMPEIPMPEVVKQLSNVKELVVNTKVEQTENLLKAETKYCNLYLDISVDDNLLSERVINDLVRHVQFSRKMNKYKVGEEISLTIGSQEKYLKDYIDMGKESISEKVTATKFEIVNEDLKEKKEEVFGKLFVCPNKKCCATLKDNIALKLKKQDDVKCPHCETPLKDGNLKVITFQFKRDQ